jgi:hypothetical protein
MGRSGWGMRILATGLGGELCEVFLEGDLEVGFNDVSHGVALLEAGVFVVIFQFLAELEDFVPGFQAIVFHAGEEVVEAAAFVDEAAGNEVALFILVLADGGEIEAGVAEVHNGVVFLEELGEVEAFAAFIGLLIKVDGADAVLDVFKVRGDVDDIVVAAHVSQEADEAALAKFDKFFGDADAVDVSADDVIPDEGVSGDAGDVFFNEGVLVVEVVDAVGGEEVLELKAIDAGGVCAFDVKVVVVVVVLIDDADAEGAGVAKFTVVNAFDKEVGDGLEVAGAEEGVDAGEAGVELLANFSGVEDGGPVGGAVFLVAEGVGF